MTTETFESQEHLLARLMDAIAKDLAPHAVLKGGMALRLAASPRSTNDLDYVFVPYGSKKEIVEPLLACLDNIEGISCTHRPNSKCLRVHVAAESGVQVQIEANVQPECATTTLTTQPLAMKYGYNIRVISVMAHEDALAHKMAAWAERRLLRDLFDIYYFCLVLNHMPRMETLNTRLKRLNFARSLGRRPGPISLRTLIDELGDAVNQIGQSRIDEELGPYMAREDLIGLEERIKTGIHRLLQRLSSSG